MPMFRRRRWSIFTGVVALAFLMPPLLKALSQEPPLAKELEPPLLAPSPSPALLEEPSATPSPAAPRFPGLEWEICTPSSVGMDASKLDLAATYALTSSGSEEERKGIRTDAFVIIRDGCLVKEGYARGYGPNRVHLGWSVSKSFVNALYGIAVQQGLVDIRRPAGDYYPPLNQPAYQELTLERILQMSAGFDWFEGYEAAPYQSSVLQMLYSRGRGDMAKFVASHALKYKPGTYWQYASGNSNLLMGILKEVVRNDYPNWPWVQLFDKIMMKSAVWERDGSGTFVGSSYVYATPRDFARFGLLFLRDGVWNGERLLPEGWVHWSTQVVPAFRTQTLEPGSFDATPGAHWWLNAPVPEQKISTPFKDAPPDAFVAIGHWGQTIFVIPSLDLVIVRMADDRDDTFRRNEWLRLVVSAIRPKGPSQEGL